MFLTLDMTFEEVAIGQTFFDDDGNEYIKCDEDYAEPIQADPYTGELIEDLELVAFFQSEIVEVDFEIEEFDD